MTHLTRSLIVSALLLAPGTALAQAPCPEGTTVSGQCVNPGLAQALRQTGIVFSQPKISNTAFPLLPADDRRYRYPNDLIPDQGKPSPTGTPIPPPPP